jgi:hypothetical protein
MKWIADFAIWVVLPVAAVIGIACVFAVVIAENSASCSDKTDDLR